MKRGSSFALLVAGVLAAAPLALTGGVAAASSTTTTAPKCVSSTTTSPIHLSTTTTVPIHISTTTTVPVHISTTTTVPVHISTTTTKPNKSCKTKGGKKPPKHGGGGSGTAGTSNGCKKGTVCVSPNKAKRQGVVVRVSYDPSVHTPPQGYWADFYDPSTRIHYATRPIPGTYGGNAFKTVVPQIACEQAHQATQTTEPKKGKANGAVNMTVSLTGVPGSGGGAPPLKPAGFQLTCKSGTLIAFVNPPPTPNPVDPDGVSTSSITVNLYLVWVDGGISRPPGGWGPFLNPDAPGSATGVHVDPVSGVVVTFDTDLGVFNGQGPHLQVTSAAGIANVLLSSNDAGIAHVTPTVKDRVSAKSLDAAVASVVNPQPAANPLPTQYVPLEVDFPPHLAPIAALFNQATYSTGYTETPIAPNHGLTYAWSVAMSADPGCASGFSGGTPTPNQASWFHADIDPTPPEPKGPCDHNFMGANGHPGTVTVTVTTKDWTCTATYAGTDTGAGLPPPACTKNS